jgi:hypothetical protein
MLEIPGKITERFWRMRYCMNTTFPNGKPKKDAIETDEDPIS